MPDATDNEIHMALDDYSPGQVFTNSLLGSQQRILDQVRSRQREMRNLEHLIEDLAQLFTQIQELLVV